jgi:hypothetical protein
MRLGEPLLPLLLRGQRFFVSHVLGFNHTAAQSVAVAQTIAVTPLLDALASDPELPSQNAHVLPRHYPAQGLKLEVAIKSAWLVGTQTSPPPRERELSPFSVSHARSVLQKWNLRPGPFRIKSTLFHKSARCQMPRVVILHAWLPIPVLFVFFPNPDYSRPSARALGRRSQPNVICVSTGGPEMIHFASYNLRSSITSKTVPDRRRFRDRCGDT